MKKHILLLILTLVFLTSCDTLAPMLFGIREINSYNAEQCAKFYKKLPKDFAFVPIVCSDEQFFQVSELGADSVRTPCR